MIAGCGLWVVGCGDASCDYPVFLIDFNLYWLVTFRKIAFSTNHADFPRVY